MNDISRPNRFRSIFISDIHLGTRGCKAEFLLDFLRYTESEYLYLVGDIVDGWRLRKSWYWAQSHNDVIQKVLRKARKGTKVVYIPGNHDEWLRDYSDMHFGGVLLLNETIHVTANGKRMLVIHGDAFDGVVRYARWLAIFGDGAYDLMIRLNTLFNHARRRLGYPYWSLSAYVKSRVKNAVQFVGDYAKAIAAEARLRDVDGVICGHIHHAEIRDMDGLIYCNDGDWVESCTALVEHFDGTLEILNWMQLRAFDPLRPYDRSELELAGEEFVKILLASDAWSPQVNGVVRTMLSVARELEGLGHAVSALTPAVFFGMPCPFYPEIKLALGAGRRIGQLIEAGAPDAIHIVTEGPIGIAARQWCLGNGYAFTTAYHTRFPEYLAARYIAPRRFTYTMLRHFHAPSRGVMVATESVRKELAARGFANLRPWGRGVDPGQFDPALRGELEGLPRPIFLSVGRVAPEKNLPAFLSLDLPGSKVVVGGGPALARLMRRFPSASFLGRREGRALAAIYASADVFVFPSRTDTFGLVMLEALASGLPVAAFPVPGPLDVIDGSNAGVLDCDLRRAALAALEIPRQRCREHALSFSWAACARQFLDQLSPVR